MQSTSTNSHGHGHLLRILGVGFGIAAGVGTMIGAGILRAPASIAANVPNAWIILALWIAVTLVATLGANIIAELASAIPRDGGVYAYVQRAFGDVAGLPIGWTMWMGNVAGISALTMAFADFLGSVWQLGTGAKIAVALAVQAVLYCFNYLGVREGRFTTQLTSALKGLALIAFVVIALVFAPDVATPVVHSHAATGTISFVALIGAYQLIDGAFAGWDAPSYFAGENEDAARSVPRALFGGIAVTGGLYLAVVAALLYALGAVGMGATDLPFSLVLAKLGGPATGTIVAGIAMLIVISCANTIIMAAPRFLYALTEDGLLPRAVARVNKGGTPDVALLMTAAATTALTLTGSFDLVFGLIATLAAASFIFCYSAFFVLRWREPELHRPYRAIGYPVLPAISLFIAVASFTLYMSTNPFGAVYAVGLWAACIPLAMLARRTRAAAPAVD